MIHPALEILTGFAGWIFLFPLLFMLGSVVKPWLKESDPLMEGIYYTAFGLGILAHLIILMGTFHALKPVPILALLLILFAVRSPWISKWIQWIKTLASYFWEDRGLAARLCQGIFLVTWAVTAAGSFLPEIGNDALCYQLNLPKLFVAQASVHPLSFDLNSYAPILMNYLYTLGLLFHSVSIAKFFHWWTGFLLNFALMRIVHQKTQQKMTAVVLALLFWLTPTVINQMTTTAVDVASAFFMFLAFVLFQKGREDLGFRWQQYLLCGTLLGFSIGTKYLSLIGLFAFEFLFTLRWIQRPQAFRSYHAAAFTGGVLMGCGYWFVRNVILTGNPVYPYYTHVLGPAVLDFGKVYETIGYAKTLVNFLILPVLVTIHPGPVDIGHWMGPLYLGALPVGIYAWFRIPESRPYFIFSLIYVVLWFFLAQNIRFLLPMMPIYLVGVATGAAVLLQRKNAVYSVLKGGAFFFSLLLFPSALYHYRYQFLPLTGIWSWDSYLRKMERSIPAAEWVNRELPENAKILNAGEVRQFYFGRSMIRLRMLEAKPEFSALQTSEDLLQDLKSRGITHILDRHAETEGNDGGPLEAVLANPARAERLIQIPSENIREARYVYSIYKLRS